MVRHIVLEGTDGVGKTTMLNLLSEYLAGQGYNIHKTKGLGGDGKDEFQNAMRTVLLHNKFPKDNIILEETLFALSDLAGIEISNNSLISNEKTIVLKDRGPASHHVYAIARGMSEEEVYAVHRKVFEAETRIAERYGALHIILVPQDVEAALNRVKERQKALGQPVTERLENLEMQLKVDKGMRAFARSDLGDTLNVALVEVSTKDTIEQVFEKVRSLVDAHLG